MSIHDFDLLLLDIDNFWINTTNNMAAELGHFPQEHRDEIVDTLFSVAHSNLQKSHFERAAFTADKIVNADVAMTRSDVLDVYIDSAYITDIPTEQDGVVFATLKGIDEMVKSDKPLSEPIRQPLYVGATMEQTRLVKTIVGSQGDGFEVKPPALDAGMKNVLKDEMFLHKTNLGFALFERRTTYRNGKNLPIRKNLLEGFIPAKADTPKPVA